MHEVPYPVWQYQFLHRVPFLNALITNFLPTTMVIQLSFYALIFIFSVNHSANQHSCISSHMGFMFVRPYTCSHNVVYTEVGWWNNIEKQDLTLVVHDSVYSVNKCLNRTYIPIVHGCVLCCIRIEDHVLYVHVYSVKSASGSVVALSVVYWANMLYVCGV